MQQPVDLLEEQLWAPGVRAGILRVGTSLDDDPSWDTVERYWMLPDASRARLVVQVTPPRVAARLLTNYRRLRTPVTGAVRALLGAGASLGVPCGWHVLQVQTRRGAPPGDAPRRPLEVLEGHFGKRIYAAGGVRRGDNRKATLHLVDAAGIPVGYAKVGWSRSIDASIRDEARALRDVAGGLSSVRSPRLLAELDYADHPIAVTAPLPPEVRRVHPADVTSQELFALTPVVRQGSFRDTAQVRDTRAKLDRMRESPVVGTLAARAADLLARVARWEGSVRTPVVQRWHGDLAPWNMARDADGVLWLWDWESSQPDAVAGLDALHWEASVLRLTTPRQPTLAMLLDRAEPHLVAAGVPRNARWGVAACYAVSLVERACTLAHQAASWSDARQPPSELESLLAEAEARLSVPAQRH